MSAPSPRQAAGFAAGMLGWIAGIHLLTGDVAAFASTPRGFLLLMGAAAEGAVEAMGLRITGDTFREFDPGAPLIPLGFAGAAYALWTFTPRASTLDWIVTAAGVVVFLAGLVLRAWAQQTLGDLFTAHVTTDEAEGIVEAGPYRHVRHPSYLALGLVFPAAPLVLSSPVGAALALVGYLPFLVLRTRLEEARLREAHGEEYEEYARRVPALVPRLRS